MPPFETAFQGAYGRHGGSTGQPRTARRYTTYQNCPLPTPEDRLLFILVYLKTYPLQVVQGRLFGMGQSKAHQWIHVLLTVLQATLRALGDAPTRSVTELAKRLGVTETDASALVVPVQEPPNPSDPPTPASAPGPRLPPFGHDGTERRVGRPHDPTEQTRYYSGKKKCHTVKNVLLINAVLTILFLSADLCRAVPTTSGLRKPPPIPYPRAVGCSRIWASWRSRSTKSRSSCQPASRAAVSPHAPPKSRQSTHRPSPRPHRARQQQRQALPYCPRHLPPPKGGRPRPDHGSLLCIA